MRLAARLGFAAALIVLGGAGVAVPASMAARWSKPSKVAGIRSLRAVSCANRSFCMAVGGSYAVAYGSGGWRPAQKIDPSPNWRTGLLTVSCVSATFCVAGDGAGNIFVYDGTKWSGPRSVTPAGLTQVSCSASTFCGALDEDGHALFYDGSTWSEPKAIPGAYTPFFISCPSVGFCTALDTNEAFRRSAGRWAAAGSLSESEPSGGSTTDTASAISCSGPHFCAALDDFGDAFTWTGESAWSRHRFDNSLAASPDAVSCPTRVACTAVDANGFATSWNGTQWSPKQQIDRHRGLNDVSCPTARFCLAVALGGRALVYR